MYRHIETACAAVLLVAIVVLVGVASVARSAGSPIIWSVEMAQLMFVWLVFLAADIALQEGRHFGLSLILDNLSAPARRIADIVNILIMMALLAFLLPYAWKNVVLMHPRLDGALRIHSSYIHGSLLVGFILFERTLLMQLIARIRQKDAA
ncbi:TRAP transporter small permease subunit [Acuticoccus sp. MNP-M23]|uniref:TRAP transporter small permease n=1 Tax=Acuticoccus sp. MNP-M23 TaxID=3072793 RepID=UPI002815E311|nr:TRAP transporter small permease subunit [Acuticoccus sp. MNP-M23]WMS40950.1 TRAP transporter small permease subunit [Acuticoccus sp. MNP-M23]